MDIRELWAQVERISKVYASRFQITRDASCENFVFVCHDGVAFMTRLLGVACWAVGQTDQ